MIGDAGLLGCERVRGLYQQLHLGYVVQLVL